MMRLKRHSFLLPALLALALLSWQAALAPGQAPRSAQAQGGEPPLGITIVPAVIRVGEIVGIQVDGDRSANGGDITVSSSSGAISLGSGCNRPRQSQTVRVLAHINLAGCSETTNVTLTLRQGSETRSYNVRVAGAVATRVCAAIVTATPSDTSVTVSWSRGGGNCVAPQRWEVAAQLDGRRPATILSNQAAGSTTVTIAQNQNLLEEGEHYTFLVRGIADNGLNIGEYGHSSRITAPGRRLRSGAAAAGAAGVFAPPPRNVRQSGDTVPDGQVKLEWRSPATPAGVAETDAPTYTYDVKIWSATHGFWIAAPNGAGRRQGNETCETGNNADCTTFNIANLTPGKQYLFQVIAVDAETGLRSEPQIVEATAAGEPSRAVAPLRDQSPINLLQARADESGQRVQVQWRYPLDYAGIAFSLQVGFPSPNPGDAGVTYRTAPGGGERILLPSGAAERACWAPSETLAIDAPTPDGLIQERDCVRFVIIGLTPGTTYPIRVKALFATETATSQFATAEIRTKGASLTDSLPLQAPWNIQAVRVGSTSAVLQWEYPEAFVANHFQLTLETMLGSATTKSTPDNSQRIERALLSCWAADANAEVTAVPIGVDPAAAGPCTRFTVETINGEELHSGTSYKPCVSAATSDARSPERCGPNFVTKGDAPFVVARAEALPPRQLRSLPGASDTQLKLAWQSPYTTLPVRHYRVTYVDYLPEEEEYVELVAEGGGQIPPGKCMDLGGPPSQIGQDIAVLGCELTIRGLRPYTNYEVRVYAHYADEVSEPATGNFRTDPDQLRSDPRIPSGRDLVAIDDPTADARTLTVQWKPGETELDANAYLPTEYHLTYERDGGGGGPPRPSKIIPGTEAGQQGRQACHTGGSNCFTHRIRNLDPSAGYYVSVTGVRTGDLGGNRRSAYPLTGGPFRIGVSTAPSNIPAPEDLNYLNVESMNNGTSDVQALIQWKAPAPAEGVIEDIDRYAIEWALRSDSSDRDDLIRRERSRRDLTVTVRRDENGRAVTANCQAPGVGGDDCYSATLRSLIRDEIYEVSVRAIRGIVSGNAATIDLSSKIVADADDASGAAGGRGRTGGAAPGE